MIFNTIIGNYKMFFFCVRNEKTPIFFNYRIINKYEELDIIIQLYF